MAEKQNKLEEIFNSALERSPGERDEFLRRACGQDEKLRSEIESLLGRYDSAFLESPPGTEFLPISSEAMIGRQLGAYRIVREIGHGGMAVVFLAERADQEYRKSVAVKMVKLGVESKEILSRFRNERQTLAALDHPNIVKLLDGGSTEEGWPYLVMEYVEGIPIDEYCDGRILSVTQRLELFRIVCAAVQYAHENQVIHRDLKPSNILVTTEGVVKLLDFGIAKLLNPERFAQTTLVTQAGLHAMTPEYASPEQVRGETVTRASDIYSLGVLLYKLLAGHSPYHTKSDSLLEIQRLICDEEPTKPSTVVGQTELRHSADGQSSASITPKSASSGRGCRPEELRRLLRGDLDAIVLKALRKQPELRYQSAEEFSDDIRRHLSGMPIRVRRPTLRYRGGKLLRRHREALAAAVVMLAFMSAITLLYEYKNRGDIRAEKSRANSDAGIQARPAVAILGFENLSSRPETAWISTALSEMLSTELAAGEKLRTVPNENIARTRIDLGIPRVDTLASDTLRRLQNNLGSDFVVLGSYFDLGEQGEGQIRLDVRLQDALKAETVISLSETGDERHLLELVSRAGTRLRERFGISAPTQAELLGIIASVPSNQEAARLYSLGLEKLHTFDALGARDLLGRSIKADPSYPLAHLALAKAWQALGYDAKAQQEAKKALDLSGSLSREDHLLVEASFNETSHNWTKAIETYRVLFGFFPDNLEYGLALAAAQTSGGKGKDALDTLAALTRLSPQAKAEPRINQAIARAALSVGDNKLARDAAENAAVKANDQGGRFLLARSRSVECRALANLAENEKATVACEEARAIYAKAGDRGGLARALHEMAEVPIDQGDFLTAEKLYREALANVRAIGDQRGIARELSNLGVIYKRQGNFDAARRMYEEALRAEREAGDKWNMAGTMGNTGNLLYAEGKLNEALKYYKGTLVLSQELGQKSSTALALSAIGHTIVEQGDLSGASRRFEQAMSIQKEIGEKTYYASTQGYLAQVSAWRGQLEEARKMYQETIAMQDQLKNKIDAADTRMGLAELDCDSGRAADAELLARSALQDFSAQKLTYLTIAAETVLARSLLQQGKVTEANASLQKALQLEANSHQALVRLGLQIEQSHFLGATGEAAEAEKIAQKTLTEVRKLGLLRLELEATLALCEAQLRGKDPAAARAGLNRLAKIARAKGFELIAQRAEAARPEQAVLQ